MSDFYSLLEGLSQRRWTVDEYHRMIATGILTTGDRVELLDGRIVEVVPQEPPHASTTSIVGNDFVVLFAGKAWVRQQLPITIAPNSETEPDIAVVKIDPKRYRDRHPVPEDIYLLLRSLIQPSITIAKPRSMLKPTFQSIGWLM
ncbi:MAG TPA: Uma2 family endonuclease [Allocoleopsis sp.]